MNDLKILLFHSTKKTNARGEAPIYVRIFVNGLCKEFSTGIFIRPENWCGKNKIIIGILDADDMNEKIMAIKSKIKYHYQSIVATGHNPTPAIIYDLIRNKRPLQHSLYELLCDFQLQQFKLNERGQTSMATLKGINTRHKNWVTFLKKVGKISIAALDVNNRLAMQFEKWMVLDKKVPGGKGYAAKHIQYLKRVLNLGVNNGKIQHNIVTYTVSYNRVNNIIYLNHSELNNLKYHRMASERLNKIKDLFLIQCYTGLAYAELCSLTLKKIHIDKQGIRWIYTTRQKTGENCTIILLPEAEKILLKYEYDLPIVSNQKYNAYLKEIADIVGIDKHLTTHVGRKTCGMLLLESGVSIEVVAAWLGHSNIKITQQYYAQILSTRIVREVMPLINAAA